ncbi:hypothetical protein ACRYJU_02825 [Alloalcanivorax xenomutans]|uniref:hypothetical protein n=1 Tax=Alloalcanivorax xenomutans TaxID=1094342 RepID=UPI001F4507CB|nr:hypothetical protein [Alloalcanivorax xenomutans]MCE7524256.1 hypothetical protein [Alloalcanivorax xenomutans]WOA32396.1 hypothetical protein RVY87_04790 [Alloalcanivorax xenomutans]
MKANSRLKNAARYAVVLIGIQSGICLAGTADLGGTYIGRYTLHMNSPITLPAEIPRAPINQLLTSPYDNTTQYNRLGGSRSTQYWQWDFDNKTITLSGGWIYALQTASPPFQLFSPERERIDGQLFPEKTPDPSEVTGSFMDNGDGTYTAQFALQIFLDFAGYPLGVITTDFEIQEADDGTLSITTLDGPDGDMIPGRWLPAMFEGKPNAVFPFRVSPQFESAVMYPDDGTDSNSDGVTDAQALAYGVTADTVLDIARRGDVVTMPIDADNDGVPDLIEGVKGVGDDSVAAGIRLLDGRLVTLINSRGNRFQLGNAVTGIDSRYFESSSVGEHLPRVTVDGAELSYRLGQIQFGTTAKDTDWDRWNKEFIEPYAGEYLSAKGDWLFRKADYEAYRDSLGDEPTEQQQTLLARKKALMDDLAVMMEQARPAFEAGISAWRAQGTELFGEVFETGFEEYLDDAGIVDYIRLGEQLSDGTVVYRLLPDAPPMRLEFAGEIPQGLRLFTVRRVLSSTTGVINGEEMLAPTIWASLAAEVPFTRVDDQTVEFTVSTHMFAPIDEDQDITVLPDEYPYEDGGRLVNLVLATTEPADSGGETDGGNTGDGDDGGGTGGGGSGGGGSLPLGLSGLISLLLIRRKW